MQSILDQPFTQIGNFTNYVPTLIVARQQTGAASGTVLGGIYSTAGKSGSPIVAAGQSWLGLSGAGKIVSATLESVCGTDVQTTVPQLSLSTSSDSILTADIFIYGVVLT